MSQFIIQAENQDILLEVCFFSGNLTRSAKYVVMKSLEKNSYKDVYEKFLA